MPNYDYLMLAGTFFVITILFRNFPEGISRIFGSTKAEIFQDPQVYALVMEKLRTYAGSTAFIFAIVAVVLSFVNPPGAIYLWVIAGFLIFMIYAQMMALSEGRKLFMKLYPNGKFVSKKEKKEKKKDQAS